jgi:hypothetical protein
MSKGQKIFYRGQIEEVSGCCWKAKVYLEKEPEKMTGFLDFLMNFNAIFLETELSIPAIQMVYYAGLINILMLMRRYRLIYLVSLVFSLYWLLVLNKDKFISLDGEFASQGWLLLGGVLVLLLIALFCFLSQSKD